MSGHSEATSEQSLVCKEASYNEVFPSSHKPEEGLSWSSKREPSTRSPVDKEEDFDGDEVEERKGDEDDEGEGENEGEFEVEDDEDDDGSDMGVLWRKAQGAQGMVILVPSFSLKFGLLMSLNQR